MFKRLLFTPILGCMLLNTAQAVDSLRVSGFGNIGAAYTDSEHYRFRTDISRYSDSDSNAVDFNAISSLGLQLDYRLNTSFNLVTQLIYRGQDKVTLSNSLNLAFLRYKATPNLTFRLGRTPMDLYLLTEYRDIGFAYPWAKVPSEVYGLIPYRTLDGGDITYQDYIGNYDYRVKIFTGHAESEIAFADAEDNLHVNKLLGASLELSEMHWTFSLKHTQATIRNNISTLPALRTALNNIPEQVWANKQNFLDGFSLENKKANYSSAGFRYDFNQVTVLAEIARLASDSEVVRGINSGYITATYNLDKSQFFYSYARTKSEEYQFNEPTLLTQFLPFDITPLIAGVEEASSAFSSSQLTHSIGWRYDFKDNIALKLQLDHSKVNQGGSTLWSYDGLISMSPEESFNSLFISMSFTF